MFNEREAEVSIDSIKEHLEGMDKEIKEATDDLEEKFNKLKELAEKRAAVVKLIELHDDLAAKDALNAPHHEFIFKDEITREAYRQLNLKNGASAGASASAGAGAGAGDGTSLLRQLFGAGAGTDAK